jgi:hypothetical protein
VAAKKKSPVPKPSESPRDTVEQRVYDLMFYDHKSRDEALGQALKEGCKYAGR